MPRFDFYQDSKHTVWYRNHFSVEAETYEQALEKIKPHKDIEIHDDGPQEILRGSSGALYDTCEPMCPEENDGQATLVVYDSAGTEICHNETETKSINISDMNKTNVNTCTHTFTRHEGRLYISLFNDEGGTGYASEEISRVNDFIKDNRITGLISAGELPDNSIQCVFSLEEQSVEYTEYAYALIGGKVQELYKTYGLLPYKHCGQEEYRNMFLTLGLPGENKGHRNTVGSYNFKSANVLTVHNLEAKMNLWWKSQPMRIRQIFSVLPSPEKFWNELDILTKINIYNYCILKENGLPLTEDEERTLLNEITCVLADTALETVFDKQLEEMCDVDGSFLDKYQVEFNRLYDDIENTITSADYSGEKTGKQ